MHSFIWWLILKFYLMPSSFNKIKRERVSHHYDGNTSSNISDHGDGRLLFGNQHWKRQKLQCLTWLIDRICFGERAALTWYLHAGVNGSGGLDSGWGVTPIYLVRLCILSLTVDHSNAQTQTLSKWLGPARKERENMAPYMRRQLNGNGALLWWNRGQFLFVGRASEKKPSGYLTSGGSEGLIWVPSQCLPRPFMLEYAEVIITHLSHVLHVSVMCSSKNQSGWIPLGS